MTNIANTDHVNYLTAKLASITDALSTMGISVDEVGGLHVDAQQYHAAFRCEAHHDMPWKGIDDPFCLVCFIEDAPLTPEGARVLALMKQRLDALQVDLDIKRKFGCQNVECGWNKPATVCDGCYDEQRRMRKTETAKLIALQADRDQYKTKYLQLTKQHVMELERCEKALSDEQVEHICDWWKSVEMCTTFEQRIRELLANLRRACGIEQ